MRKIKKFNIMLLVTMLVALLSITTCYADSKNKTSVVYNTKDLGINTINKEGSIYIPIRGFSENLYYKVLWDSKTQTVRIYDNLSDIYLNMNGDVKVNNVESESTKVPVLVNGSVYVPLRFVSENLGIDVNYDAENSKVNMTGRDIYEISQKDHTKPYLIAYTKDGRKQVGLVSEKGDYVDDDTSIVYVERTKYSDIVETTYMYSGALTKNYNNQIYVKNAKMINNTDVTTTAYETWFTKDAYQKEIPTKYYDDTVAFINADDNYNTYIKVYNDITGELIQKIDTKELYNKGTTYHGYDKGKDSYGTVANIQAVGKDFIVVSMYQPYEDATSEEMSDWMLYYYTTVINLETSKMYPVYKNFDYFKEYNKLGTRQSKIDILGDTEMMRKFVGIHDMIPTDYIYFDGIQKDGKLKFIGYYRSNPDSSNQAYAEKKQEVCTVDYKK